MSRTRISRHRIIVFFHKVHEFIYGYIAVSIGVHGLPEALQVMCTEIFFSQV